MSNGYIIADFEIRGIKGYILQMEDGYINGFYKDAGRSSWYYNYETKAFDVIDGDPTQIRNDFISITGTQATVRNNVRIDDITEDMVQFRAIPAE